MRPGHTSTELYSVIGNFREQCRTFPGTPRREIDQPLDLAIELTAVNHAFLLSHELANLLRTGKVDVLRPDIEYLVFSFVRSPRR